MHWEDFQKTEFQYGFEILLSDFQQHRFKVWNK